MQNFKIGDKVIIIANNAGHGFRMGATLTIKRIKINREDPHFTEIAVEEDSSYVYAMDIKLMRPINNKTGNFVITDPIFIIDEEQYLEISRNHEKYQEPDFTEQKFPLELNDKITKNPVIIHKIEETPYGGGTEYDTGEQVVATESGLLCIAEDKKGWTGITLGIKFETLENAQSAFEEILNKL